MITYIEEIYKILKNGLGEDLEHVSGNNGN